MSRIRRIERRPDASEPATDRAEPAETGRDPDAPTARLAPFRRIARQIAADIRAGRYRPGERLPPHRELADSLGVAVATVSRAYAELSRIGLTTGEAGRGTFVHREPVKAVVDTIPEPRTRPRIDLSINQPAVGTEHEEALREAMLALAAPSEGALRRALAGYQPSAGQARHRRAGAAWLEMLGIGVTADEVVVTGGIQQAVTVSASAAFRPGDVVLAEALTNPSFRAIASLFRLTVVPVQIDREGLVPEALDQIARERGAAGLYTMPTLQNPTGAVMSPERRAAVCEVIARRGLLVIENAAYDPLMERPPEPLLLELRRRGLSSFYISALTKVVATGIRVAFVLPPPQLAAQVAGAVFATTTLAPPITAEIGARWIMDGTAARLVSWQREEAHARREIVRHALGMRDSENAPPCNHFWMPVPEPWRADQIVTLCRSRGVLLGPPEAFVIGRSAAPQAVRLSLGAASDRDTLAAAAGIIRQVIASAPILPPEFT